ncbi:MAG TPA: DUF420 domain-containing protein [Candidatus Polarisedimenticolaceae bacterium]|nr:DUF420 domain-containing protein [Candidatus Polarisedimenticolaceae bacterium]
MRGFLGTGATFAADLNLLVQLAMGVALIVGALLARRGRYAAHGVCQTTVMVLNLVTIVWVMGPSFRLQVIPRLPAGLDRRYFAVATVHALLGAVAEMLGLYIVLVAGTKIVPKRLRFTNWKRWMRFELGLWWVVILTGVLTYAWWYQALRSR